MYNTVIVLDGGLGGGVYGAGGFQQELCKDAVVRQSLVLPQYSIFAEVSGYDLQSQGDDASFPRGVHHLQCYTISLN